MFGAYFPDITFGSGIKTSSQYYELLAPYANAGISIFIPCIRHWTHNYYSSKLRSNISPQLHTGFQSFVEASNRLSVEVHPWSTCFLEDNSSSILIENPEFCAVSETGAPTTRLCRTRPEVQQYEIEILHEIINTYQVHGIVLDYIRFNEFPRDCYCDFCVSKFVEETGLSSEQFGLSSQEWAEWRCGIITSVVRTAANLTKEAGIKLSAAVFPNWPHCRNDVGQDWGLWCRESLLDFVMPMVYSNNLNTVKNWTKAHISASPDVPVYEIIGISTSKSKLSDDEVILQANVTIDLGASGIMFYSNNPMEHGWLKKVNKIKLRNGILK